MHRRVSAGFLLALLPLLSAGCGQTVTLIETRTAVPIDPTLTYDHAYGDSITFGYGLPDAATQGYPALVAKAIGLPLTNYAISGEQACDVANHQIFPHADSPSIASKGLYTLLISTNDVDVKGSGAYEATFNLCLAAAIAWVALPAETKVLATSRAVTTTGTVSLDASNHWNALVTNAPNATITLPVSLASAGPVYLWYRIVDGNDGVFSYAIDGKIVGSASTSPTPLQQTQNGTSSSLGLLRIAAVAAGVHTLTITQTNTGPGQVGIVAAAVPSSPLPAGSPKVLVGTTPRQLRGGSAACTSDDAPCQAYIADITAQVALFAGDGLNVRRFDSRAYMSGTAIDMLDSVHPNALGNIEISYALEDAF